MQNIMHQVHPQWRDFVGHALETMDPRYLDELQARANWLPGAHALFAAFSLPLSETRYILLGESPYPRAQSANGYAFWDNAVQSLWTDNGMSKEVNRATSLRNFIKMLLLARGDLAADFSQAAIAKLDKSHYLKTGQQLFGALVNRGFLLLNASLVYSEGQVHYHARQWRPFIHRLFNQIADYDASIRLILLGRIAEQVPETTLLISLLAEHPYNISFITNPKVTAFFKPLDLLGQIP